MPRAYIPADSLVQSNGNANATNASPDSFPIECLGYGKRVPRLYEEMKGGRIRGPFDPRELENDKTQQPSLFDFARRRREVVLARQP
jgi:hypothetical protein